MKINQLLLVSNLLLGGCDSDDSAAASGRALPGDEEAQAVMDLVEIRI